MTYTLIRQKRKSIRAFIVDGRVVIKAPLWTPRRLIDDFFAKYEDYFRYRLDPPSISYLGRYLRVERVEEGFWIDGNVCYSDRYLDEHLADFYHARAKEYLPGRLDELARRFGDSYRRLRITKARTRWGSCSSRGNINLSCYLMILPPDLIDYVIIHELCHLHHFDHSRAFWELVESRCADYRRKRDILRAYALLL